MKVGYKSALTGHASAVYCLIKGTDSGHIYSGSSDGIVAMWDSIAGEPLPFSIKVGRPVFSLELWPEKSLLFIGQSEGGIHVIDLDARKELRNLQYSRKGIFKIRLLERLNIIIALGGEGNLAVIDAEDLSLKIDIPLSANKLRCVAVSSDEAHLFVGGSDGYIRVLDTAYFNDCGAISAHEGGVYALAWLGDSILVSGGRDGHLRFWKVNGFELIQENAIPAHNYAIYDVAVASDRRYFATASRDKTVKIWNVEDLKSPIRLSRIEQNGHTHSVNSVLWMSDLNEVLSAGDDKQIIAWQIS